MYMHFTLFTELFKIDPAKWILHDTFVEYCYDTNIDSKVKIKFYPWETRRYKAFIYYKQNKPYGLIEKIKDRQKAKVKASIERKSRTQGNVEKQLKALNDMHNLITIDIKKANEEVKEELFKQGMNTSEIVQNNIGNNFDEELDTLIRLMRKQGIK